MALGDIARHVDPAEKDRQAPLAFALHGRKPVAGLLETGLVVQRQPVDIVAERARGLAKMAIGHQHRACGIIGKADGQQFARDFAAQPRCIGGVADRIAQRGGGNMIGDLKPDAGGRLTGIDPQHAFARIEAVQRIGWADVDSDRVLLP